MQKYKLSDFFYSILFGLMIGFVPRLGFGLLAGFAKLCRDYETAALCRNLGNISLLLCLIIVTILRLKHERKDRLQREQKTAYTLDMAARLQENLPREMAIIDQGFQHDSQESMEAYAKACEYMVLCCSHYMLEDKTFAKIIAPYREQCYSRTYPFVDWRNGRYEHILGTELSEVIGDAELQRAQEKRERLERSVY